MPDERSLRFRADLLDLGRLQCLGHEVRQVLRERHDVYFFAAEFVDHHANAGTTSAVRTITLDPTQWEPHREMRIRLGVQGNNVLLVNGGPAGGTLVTHTAGADAAYVVRSNGTDIELY